MKPEPRNDRELGGQRSAGARRLAADTAPTPLVHVGYPKAASTTLQKHVFSKHPQIAYFGNYPTKNVGIDTPGVDNNARYIRDGDLRGLYRELLKTGPRQFDIDRAERYLERAVAHSDTTGKVMVMSHERFLSALFWHRNLADKAQRLKTLVPDARILIIVRNQAEMILSQYRNHPLDPGNPSSGRTVSFGKWLQAMFQHDDEIGYLKSLCFAEVIEMYEKLFGKKQVRVLCVEDLAFRTTAFCDELAEFGGFDGQDVARLVAGKRENIGISSYLSRARRHQWLRSWTRRVESKLGERLTASLAGYIERACNRAALTDAMTQELTGYFPDSNERLRERLGDRVQQFGYPVRNRAGQFG